MTFRIITQHAIFVFVLGWICIQKQTLENNYSLLLNIERGENRISLLVHSSIPHLPPESRRYFPSTTWRDTSLRYLRQSGAIEPT